MPFFTGEIFVSEVQNKPVLDPMGEEIGRLADIILTMGEPFPAVSSLFISAGKETFLVPWDLVNLFNRRVISVIVQGKDLVQASPSPSDILICRDLLDKQIVDINGAKLVRVNDLELGGVNGKLCLVAADIGFRGLLRRLGVEKRGEKVFSLLQARLPHKLISWRLVQTVEPKLAKLTLTVTRQKVSLLHPADLAEIISEVSQKERTALFGSLDVDTAAEALHELEPHVQVDIIDDMSKERASDILERMPPDEVADVLGDLPEMEHVIVVDPTGASTRSSKSGLDVCAFAAAHPMASAARMIIPRRIVRTTPVSPLLLRTLSGNKSPVAGSPAACSPKYRKSDSGSCNQRNIFWSSKSTGN